MERAGEVRPYEPADYEVVAAWHDATETGAAVVEDWFDQPGSVRIESDLAATLDQSGRDGQATSYVYETDGRLTAIGSFYEAGGRAYLTRLRVLEHDMPTAQRLYAHMASVLRGHGHERITPLGTAEDRDRLYRHTEVRGDFTTPNTNRPPRFCSEFRVLQRLANMRE